MTEKLSAMDMTELTEHQFAVLQKLKVSAHQEVLGKSFLESIKDWEDASKDEVLGLCFTISENPVGLTLFRRQAPPQSDTVSIHGLKIALPWQRRSYGHKAFRLAIEALKSKWPEISLLVLAVDAENLPAIAVYRGFGMKDSGPIFEGPNGKEHHMEFSLRS